MIDKLVNPNIQVLKSYSINESNTCRITLDKNESPYNIMELLKDEISTETKNIMLNRYPSGSSEILKQELSKYTGVNAENMVIGNGSDELLYMIMQTFLGKGQIALQHSPTFSMYKNYALMVGGVMEDYEVDSSFGIDVVAFKKTITEKNPKVLIICNPNNPTGGSLEVESIEYLIRDFKGIVIIDEAYYEYFKQTAVELLDKYNNIIILRTFSKGLGLAGLRVGYMLTNKAIVEYIERVRSPFNVGGYSLCVATTVIRNIDKVREYINLSIKERNLLSNELADINGVEVFKTSANFIFIRTKLHEKIYNSLLNKGISIKNFNDEKMKDCFRITVGTSDENRKVLEAIKVVYSGG